MGDTVARPSPLAELARFFDTLARIFSDPAVQAAGETFFHAMEDAADREGLGPDMRHALPRGD